MTTDMSPVIVPKSDQINADDLIAGPMTVVVEEVAISPGTEQPVSIKLRNVEGKVYRPCKSMCRVMVAAWGADAKNYAGRSMTLYRDPTVKWGGLDVGGIRISHLSHIDKDLILALTTTRSNRKPYTVKPLRVTDSPSKPKEPPQQSPTPQSGVIDDHPVVSGALSDFADQLEKAIDDMDTRDDAIAYFNNIAREDERWAAFKRADKPRAERIRDRVRNWTRVEA